MNNVQAININEERNNFMKHAKIFLSMFVFVVVLFMMGTTSVYAFDDAEDDETDPKETKEFNYSLVMFVPNYEVIKENPRMKSYATVILKADWVTEFIYKGDDTITIADAIYKGAVAHISAQLSG